MSLFSNIFPASLAALAVSVAPAFAVSTSSTSATYSIIESGFSDSDSDTAVNGTATSSVNTSGSFLTNTGVVSATQNADGTSKLEAGASVADGNAGHHGTATAIFSQTETNTSGGDAVYTLDFLLQGMSMYLNGDFGGASNTGSPFPSLTGSSVGGLLDYQISVNGTVIYSAHIEAFGGANSYGTTNELNLSANLIAQNCGQFGCTGMLVDIADKAGTATIGTIADGETFTVDTTLTARFFANGFENEAFVFFGDPTALNASGTLSSSPTGGPAVVPLPAGFVLLGSALFGLGIARRRGA